MMDTILEAYGITKLFPGVKALDKVDFDLRAGEVHLLVGENGAGKSTLAKCLLGAYALEEGEIVLDGEKVRFSEPKDALEKGIVAVYQEFTLIPFLSVAQNIFLNREYKTRLGLLDKARMEREAKKILSMLNCDYIDVKSVVKYLPIAEQQMVEIAKALSFNPKIIIFDEPTATLSEREISSLFEQIHKLKKMNIGIVYVSHRMQEFERIGDRITVLRDGHKIGTVGIREKTSDELVKMIVGRDISQVYHRSVCRRRGIALRLEGLSDKKGRVQDVDIHVQYGEIVGLAGLVGAGRTELAKLIFGIDPVGSGALFINEERVTGKSDTQAMVKKGLGMICEDRKRLGLALDASIAWNIISVSLRKYFPNFLITFKKLYSICDEYRQRFRIASPDVYRPCRVLSGGNQQKVVLAKWLSNDPNIIIFDEPTRGIDVGAKMEIYALMDKLAEAGKAILMISSELPEIIGMSDRIYVMHHGRITSECHRGGKHWNQDDIGAMMLGITGEQYG
jgi:ribose transport system ATP-binding protein